MATWKQILLKAAGFGAGFALFVCLILWLWSWYSSRPKPPKPWDTRKITAEYDVASTEKAENKDKTFAIYYTLQNNTDYDYEIKDKDSAILAAQLKREKSVSMNWDQKWLHYETPVFVPAHGRVRFCVHLAYPYVNSPPEPTKDAKAIYEYDTGIAKYLKNEMGNLNGFVLYDQTNRYEVLLPNGWDARAEKAYQNN
jgi:hypothetical protein